MIDKHMFPKNFFFAVTKEGIDGRRSLLVDGGHSRRRSSTATQTKETRRESLSKSQTADEVKEKPSEAKKSQASGKPPTKPDKDMTDLTDAMSSLQFVPPSVRFGRGRAGFSRT